MKNVINKRIVKVLLLEDDEDDFVLVRDMLSEINDTDYRVHWIADYDESMQTNPIDDYDVCLIDYNLGQYTGIDVLRQGKKLLRNIPVILITGQGNERVDRDAMDAGACDYLLKERLDAELLDRSIRYTIRRGKLINDLRESHERIRQQMIRDELTGLYNRVHFLERLHREVSSARRHSLDITLCMCDLDYFKQLNDQYGHLVGDAVLRVFGKVAQNSFRTEDLTARYGGDEFCILFPHTAISQARIPVERMRKRLAETAVESNSSQPIQITASFGLAQLKKGDSGETLIESADKALYLAKEKGRNCVEIY